MRDIRLISSELYYYNLINGRFPTTKEGLGNLTINTEKMSHYKHILFDPWGNKYMYICPPKHGSKDFDLYSFGVNGVDDFGGRDDISNWNGINNGFYTEREESIR